MFRHVLVPVDFSSHSQLAAHEAEAVARATGGSVTLLHVLVGLDPAGRRQARSLEALRQMARPERPPPDCLVEAASPRGAPGVAATIVAVARRLGCDLIVMGLQGHGGRAAPTVGATVRRVLLASSVPVRIVPGTHPLRPALGRWQALVADHREPGAG